MMRFFREEDKENGDRNKWSDKRDLKEEYGLEVSSGKR